MTDVRVLDFIRCETKAELDRLEKQGGILDAKELITFTNAAISGALPIECRNFVRVLPTETDLDAEIGALTTNPKKIRKLAGKIDRANRLHCILFSAQNGARWWAFLYGLKDLWEIETHYRAPHVHLTCYLSQPMKSHQWVLDEMLQKDRPNLPHDYHIEVRGDLGQDIRFG
ncbi:hypothetical protein LPJGGPFB_06578 [Ensifer adhaerens]|uniref:hypothetical protein n=1 Tax=Ensifer adhaerens TaxID=106592 RepID=UPI00156871DA|nr:hypothetical protein [Ensifer adhaerens]NRP23308.1 hypothetical protein [Ensifer adhaerens]